jgi:hypothetical protein
MADGDRRAQRLQQNGNALAARLPRRKKQLKNKSEQRQSGTE